MAASELPASDLLTIHKCLAPYNSRCDYLHDQLVADFVRITSRYTQKQEGRNKFEIVLPLGEFKPTDFCIKVVDRNIIVQGKIEERQVSESRWNSYNYIMRYELPSDCDAVEVMAEASCGFLRIFVPEKARNKENCKEREEPVVFQEDDVMMSEANETELNAETAKAAVNNE